MQTEQIKQCEALQLREVTEIFISEQKQLINCVINKCRFHSSETWTKNDETNKMLEQKDVYFDA